MARRIIALSLALLLLAFQACGEERRTVGIAASFVAAPSSDRLMNGLAEALNIADLYGVLDTQERDYLFSGGLRLSGKDRASVQAVLRGNGETSVLSGDFLGDTQLVFTNQVLLEFALKMYNHLGLPLQRAAVLWPYAHEHALAGVTALLTEALIVPRGTVSKAELKALAEKLAALPEEDSALSFWILALGAESGYDEVIQSVFTGLPDWVERVMPEEGLTVAEQPDGVLWTAGGMVLASAVSGGQGRRLTINIPGIADGEDFGLSAESYPDGRAVLAVNVGRDGRLLSAGLTASGLNRMEESFSVSLRLSGAMAEHLSAPVFDADGTWRMAPLAETGGLSLTVTGYPNVLFVQTGGQTLLTVSYALTEMKPDYDYIPMWIGSDAVYLFTLMDSSFADFISRVGEPAFRTLIPLVAELPAPFVSAVMDLADSAGVMTMLSGEDEGGWEDGWEEDWDGEWEENGEWEEDGGWDEEWTDEDSDY